MELYLVCLAHENVFNIRCFCSRLLSPSTPGPHLNALVDELDSLRGKSCFTCSCFSLCRAPQPDYYEFTIFSLKISDYGKESKCFECNS